MSSIKLRFLPSRVGNEGELYYKIEHKRDSRCVSSRHSLFVEEWDAQHECIVVPSVVGDRYEQLRAVSIQVKVDVERFELIQKSLAMSDYSVDDLVKRFCSGSCEGRGLFAFMCFQIRHLNALGRTRSSEARLSTLRSFMRFRGGIDIELCRLTREVVEEYEAWLRLNGVKRNTSSFYMRNLRAAYKVAVDEGLIADANPFRRVYTGVDKTQKRAISLQKIRAIRRLDLSAQPALEFARDLLMFSFYMRGMSFIDMAYLRKSNVRGGRVVYCRRKTGQELSVEIAPEAQELIDKFASKTAYLLPLIAVEDGTERRQYKNRITMVNRNLKFIGEMVGVTFPLSTYVARHSWATIARDKGIELAVISEALGHDSEATTQIYLDSICTTKVDQANRAILDDL